MTRDILVVVTLLAVLVGSGESQITFSRSWVRGKNSGDDDGTSALLSDYDETSGGSNFAREAKATSGLDMQTGPFRRQGKGMFNAKSKLLLDLLQKLRSPSLTKANPMMEQSSPAEDRLPLETWWYTMDQPKATLHAE